MTDKELLKAAARAAGIVLVFDPEEPVSGHSPRVDGGRYWNPLTDDGDALRLAVKLGLTVCNEHESAGMTYCQRTVDDDFPMVQAGNMGDPPGITVNDYAATRRAIVQAAASIGQAQGDSNG